MMEQMYAQALNLMDTLAQKQHVKGLNEFEYRLYEKLCDAMAVYFGGLKYAFQMSAMKTEIECATEEVKYIAFIAALEQAKIDEEKEQRRLEEEKKEPPKEE